MFHVVFAMQNCDKDEIAMIYEHVILKLTSCLKYEQLKRNYIKAESEVILNLTDRFHRGDAECTFGTQLIVVSSLKDAILEKSSLAQLLMNVYEAMHGQADPHLIVNLSCRLSLQTDLEKLRMLGKPIVHGTFKTLFPTLRPYHGLLLLHDPEEIIKTFLPDSSILLIRFIQTVTPTVSFEQLQTILDCSISQIYKMASHLHFWSIARVIQTISTRNFYVISDDANFAKYRHFKLTL